jgi:hypothetical protein
MPKRPFGAEMRDVSDRDIHGIPRGQASVDAVGDGAPRDEIDEMHDRVKADLKAWREGLRRQFPVNQHCQVN